MHYVIVNMRLKMQNILSLDVIDMSMKDLICSIKYDSFSPLSVSDALNGKRNLCEGDISVLFEAIQTYIKDTRRFNDN